MLLQPRSVPGAGPVLLPGGRLACLLLHGFTSQPEEMTGLATDLHRRGYTVLNQRLAGHGSFPGDLVRTRWTDWLLSVEDGLNLLQSDQRPVVLVGQSMGGMIALTAASRLDAAGVVALSTPYYDLPSPGKWFFALSAFLGVQIRKPGPLHPHLGSRREAFYPAYGAYPARIMLELLALQHAMRQALPAVRSPVLVVQSRQDFGGRDHISPLFASLGSSQKEYLWLDGFDHSIVRDEKSAQAFAAIGAFLENLESTHS